MADRNPAHPDNQRGETCQKAAESNPERLGRLQGLSLAVINAAGATGLTAHETSTALKFDRTSIVPRLSELRRRGRIADSGQRRRNASGRRAIVWIAKEVLASD